MCLQQMNDCLSFRHDSEGLVRLRHSGVIVYLFPGHHASRRYGCVFTTSAISSPPLLPSFGGTPHPFLSSAPFVCRSPFYSMRTCSALTPTSSCHIRHPTTKQRGVGTRQRNYRGRVSFLVKVARDPSLLHTRLRRFALQRRATLRRRFQSLLICTTLLLHLDWSGALLSLPLRGFLRRRRLFLVHGLVRRIILSYCVSRASVDY